MDDGKGEVPGRPERPRAARLRGAARRGGTRRVRRRRRAPGRQHVLHERHDGQPEGRRLQPPQHVPAHDGRHDGRLARRPGVRPHPAGRADVPRQRVGPRPRRRGGRRRPDHARPRPVRAGDRRPRRRGAGHRGRRRADDLDAGAARAEGPRHVGPAGDPVRRLGRAEGAVGGLPRAARAADPAGVGDDRDQPGRVGVPPRRRPGVRCPVAEQAELRTGVGRADLRRRVPRRRARHDDARAPRRRVERRAAVPRQLDRGDLLQRPAGRRELHRRRLAAHRRRGHDGRAGADPPRRPHQGPHQVRRRVDLVGRAGERADGPPADPGGRGHRRARPEVVGAPAGLRRARARRRAVEAGGPRLPRPTRRQVAAARRRRVHRRGAQDERRQVLQEDAARALRRPRAPAGE